MREEPVLAHKEASGSCHQSASAYVFFLCDYWVDILTNTSITLILQVVDVHLLIDVLQVNHFCLHRYFVSLLGVSLDRL